MNLKNLIPAGAIDYIRLIRNKIKFKGCTIETSYLGGNLTLGDKVSLAKNVRTHGISSIDSYTYINANTMIFSSQIGKFCSIANDCKIGSIDHPSDFISTNPFTFSHENIFDLPTMWSDNRITTIGNDVWVGNDVNIIGGVIIGDGAIIGTGAVVTKDIPPYAIAVGVPAKIIKYRFPTDIIEGLIESEWWNIPINELKSLGSIFQSGEQGPEALLSFLNKNNIK